MMRTFLYQFSEKWDSFAVALFVVIDDVVSHILQHQALHWVA